MTTLSQHVANLCKGKPAVLQARNIFAEHLFQKEAKAYTILKGIQGDLVPKCYGG